MHKSFKSLGLILIGLSFCLLNNCSNSLINNDSIPPLAKGTIIIVGAPASGKSSLAIKDPSGNITLLTKELGSIASDAKTQGNNFYILHSGDNTLKILDLTTLKTNKDLFLGAGSNVYEITLVDTEKAYVSNFLKGSVSVIDLTNDTNPVISTIQMPTENSLAPFDQTKPTFSGPAAIYYDAPTNKAYVGLTNLDANYQPGGPGLLAIINANTNTLESVVTSNFTNPQFIYFNTKFVDYLFISFAGSFFDNSDGAILIFDLKTQQFVAEIKNLESPMRMAIDQNGNGLFTDGGFGTNLGRFNANSFGYDKKITLQSSAITFSAYAWISDIYCDSQNSWYCTVVDNKNGYLCKIDYDGNVLALFKVNSSPYRIIEIK